MDGWAPQIGTKGNDVGESPVFRHLFENRL